MNFNDQEHNDQLKPNEPKPKRAYDLEERTAVFGENVIGLLKKVPVTKITGAIITQLVRSSNSVGANYCEADDAASKREFNYRINVSRRESKECCFHLRMIVAAHPECRDEARALWHEAKQLVKIFAAIAPKRF